MRRRTLAVVGMLSAGMGLACAQVGPADPAADAAPASQLPLPDGSRYEGEMQDGLFHGEGRLVYASGAVYEGGFRSGLRHGHGRLVERSGRVHEGEYRNGEAEGPGRLEGPGGDRYEGEFLAGELHGTGTYRFVGGAVYEGELRDGELAGLGTWTNASGDVYRGEFRNSRFDGLGVWIETDGTRYAGGFRGGDFHGHGVLEGEPATYRGTFEEGKFHGHGRFELANGNVFEGEFVDGDFTGHGSLVWGNGGRYDGEFLDMELHGHGRLEYDDGHVYEGGFVDGEREGFGIVRWEDGRRYEGGFQDGEYHGRGRWTNPSGFSFEGGFEEGRIHGEQKVTWKDESGEIRTGAATYEAGEYTGGDVPGLARPRLVAEEVLFSQPDVVESALDALAPPRPGVADLYFLGFASWGYQEVFRKEVEFTERLFREQFGADGRTLRLVNHRLADGSEPLATVTNLGATLRGLGRRLDPDEDVLFLLLTSHGGEDHSLAVRQRGLTLTNLTPERLAGLLDEAGIGWRVIVVSACYSGGFLDALRSERSLVITASRDDRKSFGCSDDAEFTYFGQALLRDALADAPTFAAAFDEARQLVQEREEAEGFEHSEPQIATGSAIEAQLAAWRRTLSTVPAAAAE